MIEIALKLYPKNKLFSKTTKITNKNIPIKKKKYIYIYIYILKSAWLQYASNIQESPPNF